MSLEEILREKNRILLLESLTLDSSKIQEEARELELELEGIFERPYKVEITRAENAAENLGISADSLVIINSQDKSDILTSIKSIITAKKLHDGIKRKQPKAKSLVLANYIYGNLSQGSPVVAQALDLVLKTIIGDTDNQEFLNAFIGVNQGLLTRQTLAEYLKSELGPIRHRIGNEKNDAFIRELSERFTEGNSQTKTDKTFLIVSSRFEGLKGKFDVVAHDSKLEDIDFSRYAAVFIDNGYNFKDGRNSSKLGNGIAVLEELSRLNPGLPMIYQTAHRLEDFTEEEIKRVTKFPNVVFMPKNRGFKITPVAKARKEIAIDEIIQHDEILSKYCVKTHRIGKSGYIQNGSDAIVATEAVQSSEEFRDITTSEMYAHRLKILAAFHTRMKDEINNPLLSPTVVYLRPWGSIKGAIDCRISDKETGKLYRRLVKKHSRSKPTTIIHNDPKWDNWFGGYVLGDFGDACPGTEYKDIARALLDKDTDFKHVLDNEYVNQAISQYIESRKRFDPKFKPAKNFCRNVKELLFIESLRLARFKSQMSGNEETVNGLLEVAKYYQAGLLNSNLSVSYSSIPSSGETAPYISLETSI